MRAAAASGVATPGCRVTHTRVAFVDVYVLRLSERGVEVATLRRGPAGRSPGSWETVHGTIEPEETPPRAALRELAEETGLTPERLYNASRVETFYRHSADEIALVPVFVALVAPDAKLQPSLEHDQADWVTPAEASRRFAWPRERRALEDILSILGSGGADLLDDVLRVC